jgi:hypothetical protein
MNNQDKLYRAKIKWDSDGCHSILYKGKYYITLYNIRANIILLYTMMMKL